MLKEVLILLISYLLGMISPSYLLGKLKGFDLRKKGTGNLGGTNAFLTLGWLSAVITIIIDIGKGFLSVYLAYYFELNILIYLAGFLAIIGHIFPFYLKFKGGKGVATAIGFIMACLYLDLKYKNWAILLLFLFAVIMTFYRIWISKKFNFNRKIYRCLAFIFPIIYFFVNQKIMLILIAVVLFLFLLLDITRLYSKKINLKLFKQLKSFVKKKEKHSLSTASFMLISFLISILLFEKYIVVLAMFFSIFGDGVAEIYGTLYGKKKFFGNKSLVGTLACLLYTLFLGVMLQQFYNFGYLLIFIGTFSTASIELLSTRIDDNLTLPISVSFVLWLISKLLNSI